MNFLKNIGKAVENAANYVGEKNRRAAALNRIRGVIRCEEKAAEKEYLALGRYYYNNLRDKDNPVTEPHCVELESIEARLDKAIAQLEKYYGEEEPQHEEVTLEDVQSFDQDPPPWKRSPRRGTPRPRKPPPPPRRKGKTCPLRAEPGRKQGNVN